MIYFIVALLAAVGIFTTAAIIAARFDEPVYLVISLLPVVFLICVAMAAYADEKGIDLSGDSCCCCQCVERI